MQSKISAQYAYSTKRSRKDTLATNVCGWLRAMENGDAVGLYCSDVSGAFDRVRRSRLLRKLELCGLPASVVSFLASWLENRRFVVVVDGQFSSERVLANSVFQGTVLGPPLWNLFYADACFSARDLSFIEVVFADDFNCWRAFSSLSSNIEISEECTKCQEALHIWGEANSVKFDPGKESFHILHRTRGQGNDFKLLGLVFDVGLRMGSAISELAREAGWRLQAVLRPRRFFSRRQTMNLYKSQVMSYLESGVSGYYHAAPSLLQAIDRIQRRLLRELGISEKDALCHFASAPGQSRREIAMLGFLHRIAMGEVEATIAELCLFQQKAVEKRPTRLQI